MRGFKAKASAAYGPALAYLRLGMARLPDDAWESEPGLDEVLLRATAECAYLSGDYGLSDALVKEGLRHADSQLEKADLHNLSVVSATSRAAWAQALAQGGRALAELGYTLASGDDIEPAIAREQRAVGALLRGRPPP